ncbi:MFS transporter [Micromonospora parathelypteridis]|uniref:EmrB/QacA subfamily drug resistance transporter n=1 Tax=Micromonospora parathelypteridis TaxID=1839617 RepID=A0A840W4K6_9ACTN|nr:MFS transporter [Micromonospora parathelypteridis]MBB5478071.1 EmrB/QacA subfamily drug resistance transporter [Micromonospora parathelypteridis]GGO13240.1 MFS transporter [Micromonospora parathelypteridis]
MTAPVPAPALRMGTAAGRGTLLAAVLASGMVFLDTTVVNVALPKLGQDLGANVSDLQWTINGYLLMLAAFVLLGGALGDRFGRRRIFLIGVVWFTAASVLCGLAQGTGWLIAARFLQGAGGALLTPGSLSVLQASFHPDDRGRAIGAWAGLSGVSTALGPFIGGWLIDALSWRWIFFLNLPLAVLVVLAAMRWVPESRDESASRTEAPGRTRRRFDVGGALLGALALAGATYALIDAPTRGFDSAPVLIAALVGVVSAVAFVLLERRRGDAAMLPTGLFSSRLFSVLNLFTVVVYAALGGFTFFFAVYLQNVVEWSAFRTGIALLPMTLLLLIGSARAGALSARIGPRLPLTVGPVIAAVGLLLLRGVGPGASYWTDVLPGVLLFGIGLTLVVAPLTASVLAAVQDRFSGVASGFNNAASRAGSLLAVAALPLVVGLSGGGYEQKAELTDAFRGAMELCAGLLVAGAVLALVLVRRPPRDAPPSQPCHSLPAATPPAQRK